ncbi:carbohydrate binding family 9 domain-containing protein [bacterium]|nr:MAG: carbohydrate binding family 9 domain-containing protein [bacterium]
MEYKCSKRIPSAHRLRFTNSPLLISIMALAFFLTPMHMDAFAKVQNTAIAESSKNSLSGSGDFKPNPILTLDLKPTSVSFVIDGEIEEGWMTAERFENFVENWPNEGMKPKVVTDGYVTHDDKNFYVAFICYDPEMKKLRASLSDRDRVYRDDFVGINVDPFGAQVNGFEFFVNPLGIQADLTVDVSGNEDDSFDAVWESAAKIYDDRWTVEIKIPFQSLRFPNKPEQDWLIHFWRVYPREQRYLYSWMPTSRDVSNQYSQAGHLKMALSETPGKTFELLPYIVGSTARSLEDKDPAGINGKWGKSKFDNNLGFNLKYGLSSNITLDMAYNPDFSQIEADEGQISVNNTFALFFNEKRPFFLEGRDIFDVDRDINLFYTRTINNPLIAGKLSGKAGKLSFGYIASYDEDTPYIMPFEEKSITLSTNQNSTTNILRTKYELAKGTYVGFIGTNRRISGGSNTVGALDTKIRLNSKYTLSALAGLSRTDEPTDSVLSEDDISDVTFETQGKSYNSDFDGENFNGWFTRVTLDRTARYWGFFAWYNDLSPGFRSENGFVRSNNIREFGAVNRYTFYVNESHPLLVRIEPRVQFNRKYNYDGQLKDWWINPQLFIQFKKQTYVWMSVAALNNENYRGRQFNNIHRVNFESGSQALKIINGGFWTETGNYINRGGEENDPRNPLAKAKGFGFQTWLTFKPTSRLSDEFNYRQFNLWTHYGGDLILSQKIYRNAISYQFTKQLFLRLIGELVRIAEFDSDEQKIVRSKYFSINPLLSYKINPFTVFFLGANMGGENKPYENYDGLTTTNQSVFVKFQYFMRI